jgi:hypothetical protein
MRTTGYMCVKRYPCALIYMFYHHHPLFRVNCCRSESVSRLSTIFLPFILINCDEHFITRCSILSL